LVAQPAPSEPEAHAGDDETAAPAEHPENLSCGRRSLPSNDDGVRSVELMAPRVTASPPPLPAGAKPDGLVVKIAKCIRYEPWSYRPGSAEWHSYERYREHTLRQALAITDALECPPPDMMKAGADALSAIFETDDPVGDLQRI
jgi:hypothetical protein